LRRCWDKESREIPARCLFVLSLHCLLGCAIGELAGLSIGVSLGLAPWATIALATVLGFGSGYLLGLWPSPAMASL